jgi:cytochrome c oxidase subunit 1
MHFLGLAGFPRRIPDYPQGYSGWSAIMTNGSILTTISLLILLYLVATALSDKTLDDYSRWV